MLNFNRNQNVGSHFRMSPMYEKIVSYLANWLSPEQAPNIYTSQEIEFGDILPSQLLYNTKLAEIQWSLKSGNTQQADVVKEWVIEHVNKWIGECHPILTQLYETFANYYTMFKDQEKKAVNSCKSAIKNQEKLIGLSHPKMADSYYLLAEVYKNYGKRAEALNSFQKAKEILIKSNNQESEAYGELCLKMGQILLSLQFVREALESGA